MYTEWKVDYMEALFVRPYILLNDDELEKALHEVYYTLPSMTLYAGFSTRFDNDYT